jgi:hypothetical protein
LKYRINNAKGMEPVKRTMYGMDASKHPSRMGQPWKADEIEKLLTSIQQKKSIADIASEHERTVGGINSRRSELAANYHFKEKRSMEDIQTLTGLTEKEIEDAIQRRTASQEHTTGVKKQKAESKQTSITTYTAALQSDTTPIVQLKKDIKELKEDVKKILEFMNALYEYENSS